MTLQEQVSTAEAAYLEPVGELRKWSDLSDHERGRITTVL
jgi:hypothetical protein